MLPLWPLYTSCDSSVIFQMRKLRSDPPDVMARSRDNASILVIPD